MIRFQSHSDEWISKKLHAQAALEHAFSNVRPTDALMTLVRKTLAWAEKGCK